MLHPPEDEAERLAAIREAHLRVREAQSALKDKVLAARRGPRPVTWAKIGAVLGLTATGAHMRYYPRHTAKTKRPR